MVPIGLFIQTLNEMIDNQGKRLAAYRNRVPNIVPLVLFGIAATPAHLPDMRVGSTPNAIACLSTPPV
jgi:hypothetical protein